MIFFIAFFAARTSWALNGFKDRAMLLFRAMRHIVRGVMALQHAEHTAVAVAEQVADDKRVRRVAAGLSDTDMEQAVAGMGG